jgi:excisionase family DNA binding protein
VGRDGLLPAVSADPVLTAHQVADLLQIHYKTLLRHVREGRLQASKQGNRLFIRRSAVEEFLTPPSHTARDPSPPVRS